MADDKRKQYDGELVVLHDMLSYGDPEHDPMPGQPKALLYASRGETLGGDDKPAPSQAEVGRLLKLGAVSESKDTLDAKLALSGQRPDTKLSAPYISLTSPAEQVRAAKAVVAAAGASPRSNPRDLARLNIGDLKVMAVAFGHGDVAESDDKDEIIERLTKGGDDATSSEEEANMIQRRDEAQISGREVSHEPGLVGSNVTSAGVNAVTGEKTEALGEKVEPRRDSKQSASDKPAKPDKPASKPKG